MKLLQTKSLYLEFEVFLEPSLAGGQGCKCGILRFCVALIRVLGFLVYRTIVKPETYSLKP